MEYKKFLSSYHGLHLEARFSRILIAALLVINCGLTWRLVTQPQIVTIAPWTLSQDAQITREDASRTYMEAWGFALAELLGNVTPGNVKFIADRLKPLLDPAIYHSVIETLHEEAQQLTEERITRRFVARLHSRQGNWVPERAENWETAQPYVETLKKAMRAVARMEIPPGYSMRRVKSTDPLPRCRQPGLSFVFKDGQIIEGYNLDIFVGDSVRKHKFRRFPSE